MTERERLIELIMNVPPVSQMVVGRRQGKGYMTASHIADHLLTNDMVAVVRCKDCQWWEARSCGSVIGKCENPRNGLFSEYTDDTDFCSYGERKEQE